MLLSIDKGLEFELNQTNLPIAIVLLSVKDNDESSLRPLIPSILEALDSLVPRTLVKIGRP